MNRPLWIYFAPAAILTAGNGLAAILAAAILDLLIIRPAPGSPGAGSITTLLPGLTYACATVMKACLVAGALSATAALCVLLYRRRQPSVARPAPRWAIASVALAPAATLAGPFTSIVLQRIALTAKPVSVAVFQGIAPPSVFAMMAVFAAGAVAAVVSLSRSEKPASIAALGLLVNAVLILLFFYLRFHAPGFDQDAWAPTAF